MTITYPKIYLKAGKEKSILRHHQWIFSGAVDGVSQQPTNGDIVEVFSHTGEYLATGHFEDSSICVRLFTFTRQIIDDNFWTNKIATAIKKRMDMMLPGKTNAFRLIHGEGDMMPGLIADYYNGIIVLQAHSVGMYNLLKDFARIFSSLLHEKVTTVYDKSASTVHHLDDNPQDGFLYGNNPFATINENGMTFDVDFIKGQKTGFFIDQRDNRHLLSNYCKDKKVLNVFGYTGAFSVAAMLGGAAHVTTIDASAEAVAMATRHIENNLPHNAVFSHEEICADVFDFFASNSEKYDVVVLDPPAFAKHLSAKANAMKAYRRLNAQGMKILNKNGVLFTFSCSQVIQKHDFLTIIYNAGMDSHKNISILHQLHQSCDHTINIYHPETEYLKGYALMVNDNE